MSCNKNFIEWKDEYVIGNKKIDLEHEMLFDIAKKANNIYQQKESEDQRASLSIVIDELYSYVDKHFKNEEKYMNSIQYPYFNEHRVHHVKLLEMLNFISLNLSILSIKTLGFELYNFIQNVFVKHIIEEDIKVVNYINNKS